MSFIRERRPIRSFERNPFALEAKVAARRFCFWGQAGELRLDPSGMCRQDLFNRPIRHPSRDAQFDAVVRHVERRSFATWVSLDDDRHPITPSVVCVDYSGEAVLSSADTCRERRTFVTVRGGGMKMKSILQQPLNRVGTDSVKWDGLERWFKLSPDVLPLWVADIDIRTAPSISEALALRAATGEFGYTLFSKEAQHAVATWYKRRHQLEVDPNHVLFSNGVVPGLTHIVEALTNVGEGVIIQSPVYPPFHELVHGLKRTLFDAPLRQVDGRYEMDFDALELAMREARLFLLCSPHNPVGRVWTEAELERVLELAKRYDVIVVADEIHADLTFPSFTHVAAARLDARVITVSAPSKAFNIAGLFASYIICSDESMRKLITKVQNKHHVLPTPFANTAIVAAYTDPRSERWLDQLRGELEQQMEEVVSRIEQDLPTLIPYMPEASYLLWLDFASLDMTKEARKKWLHEEVRLYLSPGAPFGASADSFERLNVGTRMEILEEAIQRLNHALNHSTFA